jgi:hypothetical protein
MKFLESHEGNGKKGEIYEGQTKEGRSYYSVVAVNKDGVYCRNLYQGWSLLDATRQALWYISK